LRRAIGSAARVLTGSETARRELVAFDGRAAAKTVVVPHGIDARFFVPVPDSERARVRSAYGLDHGYVLFAGNDKPHKNLEGLLAAFASFARADGTHLLVLAGGARSRAAARLVATERHGLLHRVLDVGIVPD